MALSSLVTSAFDLLTSKWGHGSHVSQSSYLLGTLFHSPLRVRHRKDRQTDRRRPSMLYAPYSMWAGHNSKAHSVNRYNWMRAAGVTGGQHWQVYVSCIKSSYFRWCLKNIRGGQMHMIKFSILQLLVSRPWDLLWYTIHPSHSCTVRFVTV